jgi:hypothetical protein
MKKGARYFAAASDESPDITYSRLLSSFPVLTAAVGCELLNTALLSSSKRVITSS